MIDHPVGCFCWECVAENRFAGLPNEHPSFTTTGPALPQFTIYPLTGSTAIIAELAALTRKHETLRNAWETSERDRLAAILRAETAERRVDALRGVFLRLATHLKMDKAALNAQIDAVLE